MISKNTKEYVEDKKNSGLYGVDFVGAVHPGMTLQDELNFFGTTQKELSEKIGYSVQTVNRIVKGREPITTDIALALERFFGGHPSAEFWLSMQTDYDRELSKTNEFEKSQIEMEFFKKNVKETFKELQKGGVFESYVLNTTKSYKQSIIKIKDFFGSHSLHTIPKESLLGTAFFRKYNRNNLNKYSLAALLKIGEKKAMQILKESFVSDYKKERFVEKLLDIKKLSNKSQKEFLDLLQDQCLEFGVIVVYVPNMPHTAFGGATFWIADRPVILLKVENQREDIFWFNFYHEAGHILKHGKKNVFVDFDEDGNKGKEEIEADEFASKMLIPDFETVAKSVGNTITEEWFDTVSAKTGVSKSIIAGRLCKIMKFDGVWKILNKYRPVIKEKINFV